MLRELAALAQRAAGQAAQLVVNQGHQLIERRLIPLAPINEDLCDVIRHFE